MKILVIGATGGTGSIAVKKLLEQGHEVTAFVRDPSKFTQSNPQLRVAQGEARNAESLEAALAGQDAVLSAFGPRSLKKDNIQEVFMRNLVAGMKKQGVRRLVNLSAVIEGEAFMKAPWIVRFLLGLLLKNIFEDKKKGELILLSSGLDYVNVRPGRLVNTAAKGGAKASLDGQGIKPLMTREDLADFMIANLASQEWVGKSPVIGY